MKQDRFLRLQEVLYRVGVSRSTVYKLMETGQFPAQIKIGYSSVWSERAITEWMSAHVAAALDSTTSTLNRAVATDTSASSAKQGGHHVK